MDLNSCLHKVIQQIRSEDLQSASDLCSKLLARNPRDGRVLLTSGHVAYLLKNYGHAETILRRAADINPKDAGLRNEMGLVLLAQGKCEEALDQFSQAISLSEPTALVQVNIGLALRRMGRRGAAIRAFEKALLLSPTYAKAHFLLGDELHIDGRSEDAVFHFRKAIEIEPGYSAARNHLAICLMEAGKLEDAHEQLVQAAGVDRADARTFCNLGNVLRRLSRFDEALQAYRQAIQSKPDFAEAHFNSSLIQLLQADFENGWKGYEWRLEQLPMDCGYPHRHGLPVWKGENLAGKSILVYDEQGYGDVFMFCRFLPLLKQQGAMVVFETRPELIDLFRSISWIDKLSLRSSPSRSARQCDFCVPLLSIPHRLGTTSASIPACVPYLWASPEKTRRWKPYFSETRLNVGIVWSGSDVDGTRRCNAMNFESIIRMPGLNCMGLQKATSLKDGNPPWMDSVNLGAHLRDFSDTAALIDGLDLIISVDTAVAHLAGAMGKQTWILLPHVPDWRWFLERTDSPWYPTVSLFRQQAAGDWSRPLERIIEKLHERVQEHQRIFPLNHITKKLPASTDTGSSYLIQSQKNGDSQFTKESDLHVATRQAHLSERHYNAGISSCLQNAFDQAICHFKKALKCNPDFSMAAYNLGVAYEADGKDADAIESYGRAIQSSPDHYQAHYNMGCLFFRTGCYQEAVKMLSRAAQIDAGSWEAVNNLGLAFHHNGQLDEAEQAFLTALSIKPDGVTILQNLGNVHLDHKNYEKMFNCYETALLYQQQDARAHLNMGKMHQEHLNLDQADAFFKKALSIDPDLPEAHTARGVNHLLRGDLRNGWQELEWRLRSPNRFVSIYPYDLDKPRWRGEPFSGKTLLVHAEQGFGDTIQFARFLPLVKKRGGNIIFEVQAPLLRLFENFPGSDTVRPIPAMNAPESNFDFYIPLMSLPGQLEVGLSDLNPMDAYLEPNEALVEKWRRRLKEKGVHIGLAWAGNPIHSRNLQRNFPAGKFSLLGSNPEIGWYSLQKNPETASIRLLQETLDLDNWGIEFIDFADTAAAISCLDLIISVDTAVAHLAGALSKQVWLLLPHFPDWRWMIDRNDSPWYPKMNLFRQTEPGAWDSVADNLIAALSELMRKEVPVVGGDTDPARSEGKRRDEPGSTVG